MTKTKNVNKFLYILLAFLIAVVAIVLPFTMNKKQSSVYADEVIVDYSFVSSDMYHFDTYAYSGTFGNVLPALFSANIYYQNGVLSFQPYFSYITSDTSYVYYNKLEYVAGVYSAGSWHNEPIPISSSGIFRYAFGASSGLAAAFTGFLLDVNVDAGFNANVYKVYLHLVDNSASYNFLYLDYFDMDNRVFSFRFFVPDSFIFASRTYYFTNALADNALYNSGYSDGQTDGYQSGFSAGQTAGYNTGYSAGDAAGYIRGVNAANQYTFTNLISATIDAPIAALNGLLNFEILGVNLSAFVYGLFTITLVIVVIKYIKGGR